MGNCVRLVQKKAEKIYQQYVSNIVYFYGIEGMDTHESRVSCSQTLESGGLTFLSHTLFLMTSSVHITSVLCNNSYSTPVSHGSC